MDGWKFVTNIIPELVGRRGECLKAGHQRQVCACSELKCLINRLKSYAG